MLPSMRTVSVCFLLSPGSYQSLHLPWTDSMCCSVGPNPLACRACSVWRDIAHCGMAGEWEGTGGGETARWRAMGYLAKVIGKWGNTLPILPRKLSHLRGRICKYQHCNVRWWLSSAVCVQWPTGITWADIMQRHQVKQRMHTQNKQNTHTCTHKTNKQRKTELSPKVASFSQVKECHLQLGLFPDVTNEMTHAEVDMVKKLWKTIRQRFPSIDCSTLRRVLDTKYRYEKITFELSLSLFLSFLCVYQGTDSVFLVTQMQERFLTR